MNWEFSNLRGTLKLIFDMCKDIKELVTSMK